MLDDDLVCVTGLCHGDDHRFSSVGVCVCVCVSLSLSLSLRLHWLIAVATYGRSSAVFLVVCILLVFLCFEVRLFVCEWGGSAEEDFAGESVYAGQLRKLIQISKWPSRRSPTVDVGLVRQL